MDPKAEPTSANFPKSRREKTMVMDKTSGLNCGCAHNTAALRGAVFV
ncbi:MAG: hypothetical protein ABIP38_01805 [Steroidobacteraceae bacterium]